MSRKIVFSLFILIFGLSFLATYLQKDFLTMNKTQTLVTPTATLSHFDLVHRLTKNYAETTPGAPRILREWFRMDVPEDQVETIPGYLLLSTIKSHDDSSIVSSYISDCSHGLWEWFEDDRASALPPGVELPLCPWQIRTFISNKTGRNEIEFQYPGVSWSFIPQVQAGGGSLIAFPVAWSVHDKKLISHVFHASYSEGGGSNEEWAAYDIEKKTWQYLPSGNINPDFSLILTATKSDLYIPSCAEFDVIGNPLSENKLVIWNIESSSGKVLHEQNKSEYKVESVDWVKKSAMIKRYNMEKFIDSNTFGAPCMKYEVDYKNIPFQSLKVTF